MDLNYMQLLAAAASMPASPMIPTSAASTGQQGFTINAPALLQNPWLQQQYCQRLVIQQYLDSLGTSPSITPGNINLSTTLPSTTTLSSAASAEVENIMRTILDLNTVQTTKTKTDTSGLVAPVEKRARLVLPTINDEDQKRLLLDQQPRLASEPTPAVQAEPPPRSSATIMPFALTPVTSSHPTSPMTDTPQEPKCSPSTSDTPMNTKEDEEPELFIDIESVDNRPEGRDRRKAYIDFYRKVKSARQRERGPLLNCALCDQQVLSNDNAIHTHVSHHADAGGFWCKLCGLSEVDKYRIYEHMRVNHPNNLELFEDRRDILKLCAVIQECFPRVCTRVKKEGNRDISNIMRIIEKRNMKEVTCALCETSLKPSRSTLTRHANHHPTYRCTTCQFTSESIRTQEEHQVEMHGASDPKTSAGYNVCSTAELASKITAYRCFSHILQPTEDENQKGATMGQS